MKREDLKIELERIRNLIREHRDCRGHDRCWIDDIKLYALALPEDNLPNLELPPKDEFLNKCEEFRCNRAQEFLEEIKIQRNFLKGN